MLMPESLAPSEQAEKLLRELPEDINVVAGPAAIELKESGLACVDFDKKGGGTSGHIPVDLLVRTEQGDRYLAGIDRERERLDEWVSQIRRDIREPDKVLCVAQSMARHALAAQEQRSDDCVRLRGTYQAGRDYGEIQGDDFQMMTMVGMPDGPVEITIRRSEGGKA